MFEKIKNAFKKTWEKIKAWFKKSETIFLARLEVVTGFLVTALSYMDWSPLLAAGVDTGFSWKQGVILGSIMTVKGLITEWARRRHTKTINDQLIPVEIKVVK